MPAIKAIIRETIPITLKQPSFVLSSNLEPNNIAINGTTIITAIIKACEPTNSIMIKKTLNSPKNH